MAALRFIAALASRLGGDRTRPFLPPLLRPLFLITEGASPVPEEVNPGRCTVYRHPLKTSPMSAACMCSLQARLSNVARKRAYADDMGMSHGPRILSSLHGDETCCCHVDGGREGGGVWGGGGGECLACPLPHLLGCAISGPSANSERVL